ncbi:hypothetical protein M758_2G035800 [Ceratodon purpureus]|nr:hypothetical protein M758_2G035800 [Ceratodon purpureus]
MVAMASEQDDSEHLLRDTPNATSPGKRAAPCRPAPDALTGPVTSLTLAGRPVLLGSIGPIHLNNMQAPSGNWERAFPKRRNRCSTSTFPLVNSLILCNTH